jgi:nucleotide-binding universal stress UspA family protein
MSYKTILVRSEADWGSDRAVDVAMGVAGMFDAALLGIGAEALDPVSYGFTDGGLVTTVLDQIDTDLASSETRFRTLTKGARLSTAWFSGSDYPLDMMNRHARGADLVVARRPDKHAGTTNSCTPTDLVMQTGLPMLLAADGAAALKAKQIVVAWHDRREAQRAISDAMPFLMKADCVHLISVRPPAEQDDAKAGLREVSQRLARHGVEVATEVVTPSRQGVAADLEAAADRLGADLIVSGVYSHNRVREWMLGGVTEELMQACGKFLLLSR